MQMHRHLVGLPVVHHRVSKNVSNKNFKCESLIRYIFIDKIHARFGGIYCLHLQG
jgi:hypothetical protein